MQRQPVAYAANLHLTFCRTNIPAECAVTAGQPAFVSRHTMWADTPCEQLVRLGPVSKPSLHAILFQVLLVAHAKDINFVSVLMC